MKKLLFISMFLFFNNAESAAWITEKVKEVGVLYGNGCILLANGEMVLVDINTPSGKAEFSIALSAKATDNNLNVYQVDEPLLGGCNTGTTIKPHNMLRVLEN